MRFNMVVMANCEFLTAKKFAIFSELQKFGTVYIIDGLTGDIQNINSGTIAINKKDAQLKCIINQADFPAEAASKLFNKLLRMANEVDIEIILEEDEN